MKYLKRLLIFAISITFFSYCNNYDSTTNYDDSTSQMPSSEYYIRYAASRRGYKVANAKVLIKNEKGQTIDIVTNKTHFKSISQTIGPVKIGFTATLSVDPSMDLTISCSKDNAPFVEKARATDDRGISYTIDY